MGSTVAWITASLASNAMWPWPSSPEIFTASAPSCGNRSRNARNARSDMPTAVRHTSVRLNHQNATLIGPGFKQPTDLFVQSLHQFTLPARRTDQLLAPTSENKNLRAARVKSGRTVPPKQGFPVRHYEEGQNLIIERRSAERRNERLRE